jgi:gamma-glutamyl:cysteine ligase YbdK (ATP-grasp superfamily)
MGQEIDKTYFSETDFENFRRRLEEETALLARLIRDGRCSSAGPVTGFELEAWLVDPAMNAAPINAEFLAAFDEPLACPELARFNVEFNTEPHGVKGAVLSELHAELQGLWARASAMAETLGAGLVAIGILPTVRETELNLGVISAMNRFRALNEQVLAARGQQPLKLDIGGHEHLESLHTDVMLEAATTSFQIHLQVPLARVREYFNAAILASAPLVGVAANSPFLFGKDLWSETRIPLFEQAVDVGGYRGAAHGPVHRVSFGTGYAQHGIAEQFEENLQHFPVLLPILSETPPEEFAHLRLHNGTLWRWNRALVGFDPDGTPHVRIEHRVMPAGPSLVDMIANAAFFYGLAESFVEEHWERNIPYPQAKDNFYQVARHGLHGSVVGRDGEKRRLDAWVLHELLPLAEAGLRRLGLAGTDIGYYLGIVERRTATGLTGSEWQRRFIARHPKDFAALTREYLNHQRTGDPVHQWPLPA